MRVEVTLDTTIHSGQYKFEYNCRDDAKAIKLPNGDYQVIYYGHTGSRNNQKNRIFARSRTFHLSDGTLFFAFAIPHPSHFVIAVRLGGGHALSVPAEVEPHKPFRVGFKVPRRLGGYAEVFYRITSTDAKGAMQHQHHFEKGTVCILMDEFIFSELIYLCQMPNEGSYEMTIYTSGDIVPASFLFLRYLNCLIRLTLSFVNANDNTRTLSWASLRTTTMT